MAGRNVVVSLTANVSGFKSAMAQASASATSFASKTSAAVSKNEGHLNKLSGTLGIVGAGLAIGIGAAVKAAANFDQAMSNVAATGADAKSNIDALRQAAIEAGAATSFSASEAAQGLEELSKAGISAKDSLGGGLKGALDLAAAGQLGVGQSAEIAATAMNQFGLAGKDVPHIADLLAAGAGKAQGSVADMGEALKNGGLVANQFGLSIEETTGTLAAFAANGLVGAEAGTQLKSLLLSLASPSAEAERALKGLGIATRDANGEFVGSAGLAGELQDKLKGVDSATRDAALSTIFGSFAIQGANILYKEGAQGITDWTAAVNDQGFAAETAATKMDNLKGDLEAMSGSFETALIGLGEGANGPLRSVVQGATDAINAFNDLGSGTKGALLIVAGSLAGLALGAAGLIKLVTSVNEARTAMSALATDFPRTASGLSKVGKAAGIAAAGFAALQVAAAVMRQFEEPAMISGVEASANALLGLSKTAPGATRSLDDFFKTTSGGALAEGNSLRRGVEDLSGAFDRLLNRTGYEKFADGVDGIFGMSSAADKAAQSFGNMDQALLKLKPEEAAAAFGTIRESAVQQGASMEELTGLFPAYRAQLESTATELGVVGLSAADYADWMGGKIPAAITAASTSAGQLSPALSAADAALAGMKQSSADAAQSLDDMVSSLFAAGNAALQMSGSQIGFEAAVDAATAAVEKNGKTLKIGTAAGRENKTALDNIATAAHANVEAMVANGASTEKVTKATENARDSFIAAAMDMGKSRAAAEKLADGYGLIPKDVKTKTSAPGAKQAKIDADKLNEAIKDLPKDTQAKIRSAFDRGGIDAALRELRAVNGKTAITYVKTVKTTEIRTVNNTPGLGGNNRAAGGYISGPGNSISDSISARLSNGEYVLRAAAVQAIGIAELHRLNSLGGPQRAFAGGGLVGVGATGFAAGGPVSASEFGRSNQFSVAAIVALIRAIQNPVRDLTSATKAFAAAQESANAAARSARAPKGRLDAATDRYEAARDKRDAERAKNAAALAKQKERVARAQKEYDRLDKAGDKTKGRTAADVRAEKAKAELDRARDRRDKISRTNTAEMARLNARVTATSKDKTKAQADYNVYADRAKVATDRLKDAHKNLADQQKAVADSARQVSETFAGKYQSGSTDAKDWLESKKNGAADLIKFNAQIMALRKVGLNETDIQAIINQPGGGTVAKQIIDGGTNLVKSLNAAQQKLQDAADKLGFNSATGVGRYATGGPVFGSGTSTSDSISARLSNGEYVVNAAATAANREVLDAMNYGRRVIDRNYVQGYAYGGYVRREPAGASPALIAAAVRAGLEGARLEGHINGDYIEARVRSHLTTVGSNAQYRRLTR